MADWLSFALLTLAVSLGFVVLARASARAMAAALDVDDDSHGPTGGAIDRLGSDRLVAQNVLASHGLLVAVVLGGAWLFRVPWASLGLGSIAAGDVLVGLGFGLALAAGNEASVRLADRVGLDHDERLRALLAPETRGAWGRLLGFVLPVVALGEELVFRGAFIGGLAAGFDLPLSWLVVVSSVLFGIGHDLQGRLGVVVTTGLGGLLAGGFVLTGSLVVVAVAHYVVNAVEFVVNERPGREP